jgi:hypothetical protein
VVFVGCASKETECLNPESNLVQPGVVQSRMVDPSLNLALPLPPASRFARFVDEHQPIELLRLTENHAVVGAPDIPGAAQEIGE